MDQETRGIELHRYVGELPAQSLELGDRAPELLALDHEGERPFVRALREAERDGGGAETLTVVRGHQLLEPVAGSDEHVLRRDLTAFEVQLALRNAAEPHH